MKNLHIESLRMEESFRTIIGLKNYIENHSEHLKYHNRSGKKMYETIISLLNEAISDREVRDNIINGLHEWRTKQ